MSWMIYGATGYTGKLIAREAAKRGLTPILAGRNAEKVALLADELRLECRVFDVETAENALEGLVEIDLVLNCAGPFSQTADAMMNACIENKTHYLDITGELEVFELAQSLSSKAKKKRVVLCPGVGFDVIPTDCVASRLSEALPDANFLTLGFDSRSGLSAGTAKTTIEAMRKGGRVRHDGEIKQVPMAYKTREIDFGDGAKLAVTIPWGDVSTAFHTTGIPNVEVYIPTSEKQIRMMKAANLAKPLLGLSMVQDVLKKRAEKVDGPDEEKRSTTPAFVWGEAVNAQGDVAIAKTKTANGYTLTIWGSLACVCHVLMTRNLPGGAYTPSKLMGNELIERLDGCSAIEIVITPGPQARNPEMITDEAK